MADKLGSVYSPQVFTNLLPPSLVARQSSWRADAGNSNCSLGMASNADQLHQITSQKFKTDIVVDINHCPKFVNKTNVQSKPVAFTVHIPFEQLKSWYDNKLSTLADYSYVQVLNAFLGKRYSLKIRENCSRSEECLRVNCTELKLFIWA